MKYLFITDIQYRKTFDVISMLKHFFPNEHFILASTTNKVFSFFCYGKCDVVSLRTSKGFDNFLVDIRKIQKKYANDELIYLPIEELTTDLFIRYLSIDGSNNWIYLLPPKEVYELLRSKRQLNIYCLSKGFPAPRIFDIKNLCEQDFPIILKPNNGSGSQGIIRIHDAGELTDSVKTMVLSKDYLAQELITNGKDVEGAFYLCHYGEILGAYTHIRIRTCPEEGGVTVLSKIDYNEELINQGAQILKSVEWSGLIMLEFLWDDKTKQYKVIEANPRLWGSIMLSEYGGAFLLQNYIRTCLGQPLIKPEIDKEKYIRWFFPMDILFWFKKRSKIKNFWHLKNQCFINWTYARKDRAMTYLLCSVFSASNLKKLFYR